MTLIRIYDFFELQSYLPNYEMFAGIGWLSFEWLEWVVRSSERLCEGELCCLGHRRRLSALYLHLIYQVYQFYLS